MQVDTEPQEEVEQVDQVEQVDDTQSDNSEESREEQMVPVSAIQKERRRRQESEAARQRAEIEAQYLREQFNKPQAQEEEDDSLYETTTRKDLIQSTKAAEFNVIRAVEERRWEQEHSEKVDYVNENLKEFLNKRPNLRSAINDSVNRYEEAFTLMQALTQKQRREIEQPKPKKQAPNSPAAVPKAAAMNQAVDVMSMSDEEFNQWRASKRRR